MTTARTLQRGLTEEQARLLERHRRGVVRLARALAETGGCEPSKVVALLAHKASRVGCTAQEQLDLPDAGNVVVIPGVLRDLPRWIARLALSGPLNDCTGGDVGIAVIVVDKNGEMAVCRVACEGIAATGRSPNRSIIPPG